MADFNQIINKLGEDYNSAKAKGTADGYSRLSTIFDQLERFLREYIQDLTEEDIKKIVIRLKHNENLTAADLEKVRLWVVGDAENYVNMENNFADWQQELQRIIGEIKALQTPKPDLATACKLRALFRDGAQVITDIFNFVEQRERVKNFLDATRELDAQEREILIKLLEQKLNSTLY